MLSRERLSGDTLDSDRFISPIVRIGPEEIHVRDPNWYNELMTGSSRPRDKSEAFAGRSGRNSIFGTVPHDHHRLRRAVLNPFFIRKSITSIEPLIQDKIDKLCIALSNHADNGEPVELGLAYMALSLDIISHYAFGKSFGLVEQPEFAPLWKDVVSMKMENFALVRNFSWLPDVLKAVPHFLTRRIDQGLAVHLQMEQVNTHYVTRSANEPPLMLPGNACRGYQDR